MRLSADSKHPDFKAQRIPAYVFLNGEYANDCIHADEEGGTVTVAEKDKRGRVVVRDDEIATKVLRGEVRIHVGGWDFVNAIGFDEWMRQRIEKAHAKLMGRPVPKVDCGICEGTGVTFGKRCECKEGVAA
jgi:hypothetical protein